MNPDVWALLLPQTQEPLMDAERAYVEGQIALSQALEARHIDSKPLCRPFWGRQESAKTAEPSQRRQPWWEGGFSTNLRAKCRRGCWTSCRQGGAQTHIQPPSRVPSHSLASGGPACSAYPPSGFAMRTLGLIIAKWQTKPVGVEAPLILC